MSEELMDGKDRLLEEIRRLKELLKGVREERDYLFNKLSTEKLWLQQENTQLKQQLKETNNCLNLQIANVTLLEKELKDKDEKISKAIEYINTKELPDYGIFPLDDDDYRKDILEILESK